MTDRSDLDLDAIRSRLDARRQALQDVSASAEDARKPVELDQQMVGRLSRMDALQNQQMHLEQERRRVLELKRIEATLARLDDEDYGYCHNCGEEIELKRLELDPTTPLCVSCARDSAAAQ